ncbi:MAG: YCF48-related protein [Kiritimatiellae bacterium]|nr:YCF48-related protein [Kiritimatiellia bacterium]
MRKVRLLTCLLAAVGLWCATRAQAEWGFIGITNGYFYDRSTGEPFVPHGIAYQTWNRPLGVWQTFEQIDYDLDEMVKMGANSVRIDMVWQHIEGDGAMSVAEGDNNFSFEKWDYFVQACEERNLRIFALVGYQWPPSWFPDEWYTQHPPSTDAGGIYHDERWPSDIINYEHPQARAQYQEWLYSVANHFKDSKAIVGWIVGNESGYLGLWSGLLDGYDPECEQAFRVWCEAKYGTIAACNAAWGGTTFASFDDIVFVETYRAYGKEGAEWADMVQWREDSIAHFTAIGAVGAKSGDTNHLISYSTVGMQWGEEDWRYHAEDRGKITDACIASNAPIDFFSVNNYPWSILGHESQQGHWGISYTKKTAKVPVLYSETGFTSSETMWPSMNEFRQGPLVRNALWESLEAGAIGTHVFSWMDRPYITDREKGFGIVYSDRRIKPAFWSCRDAFNLMDQVVLDDLLMDSDDAKADVAFLWTAAVDSQYNRYECEMQQVAGALERLGYEPWFMNLQDLANGDYTNYKAVFLPRNMRVEEEVPGTGKTILNFLREEVIAAGIHVIAGADLPGQQNPNGLRRPEFEAEVSALFGIDASDVGGYEAPARWGDYVGGYWHPINIEFTANAGGAVAGGYSYRPKVWRYSDEVKVANGGVLWATMDSQRNKGYEDSDTELLQWEGDYAGSWGDVYVRSGWGWAYEGNNMVQMYDDAGMYQDFPVVPFGRYTHSAYLRINTGDPLRNGKEAFIAIEWYDKNTNLLGVSESAHLTTDTGNAWIQYKVDAIAPADVYTARRIIRIQGPGDGSLFVDNNSKNPAVVVKDHGTAKAAIFMYSVGDIAPDGDGDGEMDVLPWKWRSDIFGSVMTDCFGVHSDIEIQGANAHLCLAEYRTCSDGSTLWQIKNYMYDTNYVATPEDIIGGGDPQTFTIYSPLFVGKTVEALGEAYIIEQDSDGTITLTLDPDGMEMLHVYDSSEYLEGPTVAWTAMDQQANTVWNNSGLNNCSFRVLIKGDAITHNGSVCTLTLQGRSSGNYTAHRVSVVKRDGASLNGVDSTYQQVTFGGTWDAGAAVAAGTTVTSDPFEFDLAMGEDLFVTYWLDAGEPTAYMTGGAENTTFVISGTDHTATIDWGALATSARYNYVYAVAGIDVLPAQGLQIVRLADAPSLVHPFGDKAFQLKVRYDCIDRDDLTLHAAFMEDGDNGDGTANEIYQELSVPVSGYGLYTNFWMWIPDADTGDSDYISTEDGGEYVFATWLEDADGQHVVDAVPQPTQLKWGVRPTTALPTTIDKGDQIEVGIEWEDLYEYLPWEVTPMTRNDSFPNRIAVFRSGKTEAQYPGQFDRVNEVCDWLETLGYSSGNPLDISFDNVMVNSEAALPMEVIVLEAEDMPTHTTGAAYADVYNIWSVGYIEDSVDFGNGGTFDFVIHARSSYAGGAWAIMELRIDQNVVATMVVDSDQLVDYTAAVEVPAGVHNVAVAFINDYYEPGVADRNLYVDKISVTEQSVGESMLSDDFSSTLDAWTRAAGGANWDIEDGALCVSRIGNSDNILVAGNADWSDFTVSADICYNKQGPYFNDAELYVRYQDRDNFVKVGVRNFYGFWRLKYTVRENASIVDQGWIHEFSKADRPVEGVWFNLMVNADGNTYTVSLDGEEVGQFTTGALFAGRIGLGSMATQLGIWEPQKGYYLVDDDEYSFWAPEGQSQLNAHPLNLDWGYLDTFYPTLILPGTYVMSDIEVSNVVKWIGLGLRCLIATDGGVAMKDETGAADVGRIEDLFGVADYVDSIADITAVQVNDNSHYITHEYAMGDVEAATGDGVVWPLVLEGTALATVGNAGASVPGMIVNTIANDPLAPKKVFCFNFPVDQMGQLTNDFSLLAQRALQWVQGEAHKIKLELKYNLNPDDTSLDLALLTVEGWLLTGSGEATLVADIPDTGIMTGTNLYWDMYVYPWDAADPWLAHAGIYSGMGDTGAGMVSLTGKGLQILGMTDKAFAGRDWDMWAAYNTEGEAFKASFGIKDAGTLLNEDNFDDGNYNGWTITPNANITWSVEDGSLRAAVSGAGGVSYIVRDGLNISDQNITVEYDTQFSSNAVWSGFFYRGVYLDVNRAVAGWRDDNYGTFPAPIKDDEWHHVSVSIREGDTYMMSDLAVDGDFVFVSEPIEVSAWPNTTIGFVSPYEAGSVNWDNVRIVDEEYSIVTHTQMLSGVYVPTNAAEPTFWAWVPDYDPGWLEYEGAVMGGRNEWYLSLLGAGENAFQDVEVYFAPRLAVEDPDFPTNITAGTTVNVPVEWENIDTDLLPATLIISLMEAATGSRMQEEDFSITTESGSAYFPIAVPSSAMDSDDYMWSAYIYPEGATDGWKERCGADDTYRSGPGNIPIEPETAVTVDSTNNEYVVFSDLGMPVGCEGYTWGGTHDGSYSGVSAPEGTECWRTYLGSASYGGWGSFYLNRTVDLTNYNYMRFWVRATEPFVKIQIEAPKGTTRTVWLDDTSWDITQPDSWQEITIPISDFGFFYPLTNVYGPFKATGYSVDRVGVDFVDADHGWTVGVQGPTPCVRRTVDGGASWEALDVGDSHYCEAFDFVSTDVGWIVGLQHILRTTDGGDTWVNQISNVTPSIDYNFLDVFFIDELRGWCCSIDGTVCRTIDGGASWTRHSIPLASNRPISNLTFVDQNHGWAEMDYQTDILRTTDGGVTWTRHPCSTNGSLQGIYFNDVDHGWAYGWNGGLYETLDGGLTWNNHYIGNYAWFSMDWTDDQHGWVMSSSGSMCKTIDGGQTWSNAYCLNMDLELVRDIKVIDGQQAYAVGRYGSIYMTTNINEHYSNWEDQLPGAKAYMIDHVRWGYDEAYVAANQPPTVNAGDDKTIMPGQSIDLNGFVQDDGLPSSILTSQWIKVSGPGTVTFGDAASLQTTASFSSLGTYVLGLIGGDSELTTTDELTVVVKTNSPPTVTTCGDQSVEPGVALAIPAAAQDDGLPSSMLRIQWSKLSGPGTVQFANYAALVQVVSGGGGVLTAGLNNATATFSTEGVYVLGLSTDDGDLWVYDEITVTVGNPPPNTPPTVQTVGDQTVPVGQELAIPASAQDDGRPDRDLEMLWSKLSGPGDVTFENHWVSLNGSGSGVVSYDLSNATASFSQVGTYVIRLTADDGELTVTNDVTVTVTEVPVNQAPVVDAGADQTVNVGDVVNLHGIVTDDGLPWNIVEILWYVNYQSENVTFADASQMDTTATFSEAGTYTLKLQANDYGLVSDDTVVITVNAPVANIAPMIQPVADQTVAVGEVLSIPTTVLDDGLPIGKLMAQWIKYSGPGTVTFGGDYGILLTGATGPISHGMNDVTATFSQVGTYVIRLMADDDILTTYEDVTVTVTAPVNAAPTIQTVGDQTVAVGEVLSIPAATVQDDGLPIGKLLIQWRKVSGPGSVSFGGGYSVSIMVMSGPISREMNDVTATFSQAGTYVIQLMADDDTLTTYEDVTVTVTSGQVNQAPVVNAGPDQTVNVGDVVNLHGIVTDDGLPWNIVEILWYVNYQSENVTFADASQMDTTATFSEAGTYTLKLQANDYGLVSDDTVVITVLEGGGTPVTYLSEWFNGSSLATLSSGAWTMENPGNTYNTWSLDGLNDMVEVGVADPGVTQDTYLISPALNFTGLSGVELEFLEEYVAGSSTYQWSYGYVLGSIDGGATWTAYSNCLHSYPAGSAAESTGPHNVTLDMSWADGQSNVKIAWRKYGNCHGMWNIHAVNISVVLNQ